MQLCNGMAKGRRVGRGMFGGVTTHTDCKPRAQAQVVDEGLGETLEFIGDDAPGHALALEALNDGFESGHEGGVSAEVALVDVQELVAKRLKLGRIPFDTQCLLNHSSGALGCIGTKFLNSHGGQALLATQLIGNAAQIGRSVEQGAIEIKQHRAAVVGMPARTPVWPGLGLRPILDLQIRIGAKRGLAHAGLRQAMM